MADKTKRFLIFDLRLNFGQRLIGLIFRLYFLVVCNAVKQFLTPGGLPKACSEPNSIVCRLVTPVGTATCEKIRDAGGLRFIRWH
jgi:hypothetical protein